MDVDVEDEENEMEIKIAGRQRNGPPHGDEHKKKTACVCKPQVQRLSLSQRCRPRLICSSVPPSLCFSLSRRTIPSLLQPPLSLSASSLLSR